MLRLGRRWTGIALAAALPLLLAACGDGALTISGSSYDADRLVLRDFIGTLTIETAPAGGEITVQIEATRAQRDILPVTLSAGTLTIEWDGEPDRPRRWYEFWRGRWMADLNVLSRYPTLVLTVPADVEIEVSELIGRWTVADRDGPVTFGATRGEGSIGAMRIAEIAVTGDANLTIGPVSERLSASITGSGSVTGATAATAELSVAGSGHVRLGDVAGPVIIEIAGSGSATIGAAGEVEATVSGSGSVTLGAVAGLRALVQGSGDVVAAAVNGAFSALVSGSGNVTVDAGRGSPFEVTIAGSGNIRFGGTAVAPRATISGSGSLALGQLEGELNAVTTGTGRVQVLRTE